MSDHYKKFDPNDDLSEENGETVIKPDPPNARRYSISKSGRFKQIIKHREALDETLFNDQDKIDYMESSKSICSSSSNNINSNNNNNTISKKRNTNSQLARKSYSDLDIEAWIENSFRQTFEDYKTIRRKSSASVKSNTMVETDGHLETAL